MWEPRAIAFGRLYLFDPVADMLDELVDSLLRHAELAAGFAPGDGWCKEPLPIGGLVKGKRARKRLTIKEPILRLKARNLK